MEQVFREQWREAHRGKSGPARLFLGIRIVVDTLGGALRERVAAVGPRSGSLTVRNPAFVRCARTSH